MLQLGFVDQLLGEFLTALDDSGLYEESLLVVTADHGLSFQPGQPVRGLTQANYSDIAGVPLFVKMPGQLQGGPDDRPVQSVDVLSMTLAALAGSTQLRTEAVGGEALRCPLAGVEDWGPVSVASIVEAARLKTILLGSGEEHRWPAPTFGSERLGMDLPDTPCSSQSRLSVVLQEPNALSVVDRESGFVPAEIVGTVFGPGAHESALAIAVNGRVWAFTRPYRHESAGALFSAIVPEQVIRNGFNEVEVLEWTKGARDCELRRIPDRLGEVPSFVGVRLGVRRDPRVAESGFRHSEIYPDGSVIRWTNGNGRLSIPLPAEGRGALRAVRIRLGAVRDGGSLVRVLVNEKPLFEGRVAEAPWSGEFPVEGTNLRGAATVTIQSDTFLRHGRPIGVAVAGVWLVGDAPQP